MVLPCVEALLFWNGHGRIRLGGWNNDENSGIFIHVDDPELVFDGPDKFITETTTQDHRRREVLGDEEVHSLRALANLNHAFNSPHDGHGFTACVSNVEYVIQFAELGFQSFWEPTKFYKTGAASSIEDRK